MGKAHPPSTFFTRVISSDLSFSFLKDEPFKQYTYARSRGSLPLMGMRPLYWLAGNAEYEAWGERP